LTVVVVGNALVDIAYQVERLPRSGETACARERTADVAGKGLNQAIIAHRGGAEVRICAGLGDDPAASTIRTCLEAEGLSAAWLVSVPCPTDESIV
jgi:ribokinase